MFLKKILAGDNAAQELESEALNFVSDLLENSEETMAAMKKDIAELDSTIKGQSSGGLSVQENKINEGLFLFLLFSFL